VAFADSDDGDDEAPGGISAFGVGGGGGGAGAAALAFGSAGAGGGGGGEAEVVERHERAGLLARTIGFLRNSWAELQRVQWPDRQQVAQGTGVVLGFVVLTGIFLGVADFVAGKLVNWIV